MITRQWWRRVDACVALAVGAALHSFATSRLVVEASTVAVLLVPADEVASELNP